MKKKQKRWHNHFLPRNKFPGKVTRSNRESYLSLQPKWLREFLLVDNETLKQIYNELD